METWVYKTVRRTDFESISACLSAKKRTWSSELRLFSTPIPKFGSLFPYSVPNIQGFFLKLELGIRPL
jgi:hypothetical protein